MAYTWWITGLPCAGKTTLANALAARLRAEGDAVCVLDGDVIRAGLSSDLGFSMVDRHEQARRTAEMAAILNNNNINAIVALVSPAQASRELARHIIGNKNYIEVYLSTPIDICQQRDSKGWYAKALLNNQLALTGFSAPYEVPYAPELLIDSSITDIAQSVELTFNTRPML